MGMTTVRSGSALSVRHLDVFSVTSVVPVSSLSATV